MHMRCTSFSKPHDYIEPLLKRHAQITNAKMEIFTDNNKTTDGQMNERTDSAKRKVRLAKVREDGCAHSLPAGTN